MSIHNDLRDEQIDDRIDRLLLVVDAMWKVMQEQAGLDEHVLFDRIDAIDREDGVADRRRRVDPIDCSCGAKFNQVTHTCDFCGAIGPARSIFDYV